MKVNPYLTFNGDCEEAFRAYARILDGRLSEFHRFAGTPGSEHVPAEAQNSVMHVSLEVGGDSIMGSDAPGMYEKPQGISVSLHPKDPAHGESIFNALADGGTVIMPYEETFWAHRFGMLVDRFGIPWMVNVDKTA